MPKQKEVPIVEAVEQGLKRFKSKGISGFMFLEFVSRDDEGQISVRNLLSPSSGVMKTSLKREVLPLTKEDEKFLSSQAG